MSRPVVPADPSFLYASQADLDPAAGSPSSPLDTFVLMYDECSRRTPLGADEYFRVVFKTVETEDGAEKLEHYVIHIFSDGTIVFFEDGAVQPPGRAAVVDGMRGKVGFWSIAELLVRPRYRRVRSAAVDYG